MSELVPNMGQVPGLPRNPRKWSEADVEDLVESIRETPELLEARGILVYPYGGKFVILGGNMRYDALCRLGWKAAPCFVYEGVDLGKLREIVIKDNSQFGSWDMDALANEWDDVDFAKWGIKGFEDIVPQEVEEYSGKNKEVDVDSMNEAMKMKFKFTESESAYVEAELAKRGKDRKEVILKALGYGD